MVIEPHLDLQTAKPDDRSSSGAINQLHHRQKQRPTARPPSTTPGTYRWTKLLELAPNPLLPARQRLVTRTPVMFSL
ncbi:MAG: hypothetical protein H6667_05250 [Ardenticatenaceae bacterium]|nr:hypothetical protein [Ardenticatenaceae bacterium]